ncbi:hypothetical protein MSBR3_0248 [Methanosarcina barkeri 3]|uniref:Uncharacterized protein n=1 Tax=Methanosarcina barkeri 3 TaxID=1434107 RepID=A0A0E3SHV9_METBA|nr:hypothetical protein MSBR3_0248 [Methanosarcina barkeri 3]
MLAPEKIIKKIKPLVEISKAEKIHLSSCMAKMCPFVNKYKSAINVAYPDVEVVMGTDAVSDQHIEIMKTMFKKLLTDPNPDISEEYLKITQSVE